MTDPRRASDRLPWLVAGASLFVIGLTLLGTSLLPPTPLPGARGALPRMRMMPGPVSMGDLMRSMGIGSMAWYACILSAPIFIGANRALQRLPARWWWTLVSNALLVVVLVCGTAWLQYEFAFAAIPGAPPLWDFMRAALLTGALPFVTIALVASSLESRSRAHDRALDEARVHAQLAEARLAALTAQLQPHFLFNTLQAISTLIARDPVAADRMLASLSDLLREVLRRGERREVSLEEELRVLEPYLDISRTRFGERLTVTVNASEAAHRALVPFFVLQPLVENALHHGIGSRAGAGTVRIEAEQAEDRLWLSVTDDGSGVVPAQAERGIGLPNTRARLQELYGTDHTLELGNVPGGFRVRVGLPYRESQP